jgi:hypothetical protein
MWQAPRCHPVQDYHTVIPFQHKRSTKQAKHQTKNKQKATDSLCLERICFRFTANVFKLFFFFFFINILDLLIFSNAMSFFLNFYENLKFSKMFKFLFFK